MCIPLVVAEEGVVNQRQSQLRVKYFEESEEGQYLHEKMMALVHSLDRVEGRPVESKKVVRMWRMVGGSRMLTDTENIGMTAIEGMTAVEGRCPTKREVDSYLVMLVLVSEKDTLAGD